MPELPEVETIVRQLAPVVEGRRLDSVEVFDERWCRPVAPADFAGALGGATVRRLSRRGKYLVWGLDDRFLVCHLRMTGVVLYDPPGAAPHARARLGLDDGHCLVYCDIRRFGTAELLADRDALASFFASRLGVEPFSPDFTAAYLRRQAAGRRVPVKAFLLDQRRVAGVGNIYADEALFAAGVHPLRAAGSLRPVQVARLRDAVVASLQAGIAAGGATIDDYRDAAGVRGAFQEQFMVHRRAGQPCLRCGATIVKLVVAGRGTYVCERCQSRPRRVSRTLRRGMMSA